jgi:hypothetical protein
MGDPVSILSAGAKNTKTINLPSLFSLNPLLSKAFSYNPLKEHKTDNLANNNITNGSMFPIPGTQLRVPTNINSVLNLFDQVNNL